jgi:hypothetical protein
MLMKYSHAAIRCTLRDVLAWQSLPVSSAVKPSRLLRPRRPIRPEDFYRNVRTSAAVAAVVISLGPLACSS